MDIKETIKNNKPKITNSSIKVYNSLLNNLYKKYNNDDNNNINIEWFNNQDEIINLLKDKSPSSRKTMYSALIAVTNDKNNDKYKNELLKDSKNYDEYIKTQTKSDKQATNWKDFDKIKEIFNKFYIKIKPILNSKTELSKNEYFELQDFIILSLVSGIYIPPRRSQDWINMKNLNSSNIDKSKDNYIDKNKFIFNTYKTSKFYNQQTVDIPKELKTILNKWAKFNKNEYLINDRNNNKYSNVKLTQKLNSLLDGKISTSMLRHIYLSDKLKDIPKLNELEELAHEMGHSINEQLLYIKK